MKNSTLVLLILSALLNGTGVMSQKIVFNKVALSDDNSIYRITSINQDRDGYMWFSSNGMLKFDGYQVVRFANDPFNPNSIASNQVNCIFADPSGIIWAGTNGKGLDKFDPSKNLFTHFRHQSKNSSSLISDTVTTIAKDKEGFLWIGTVDGLDKLNTQTGTFEHFSHSNAGDNSLSNNYINSVLIDRKGEIWIAANGGDLNKYNKQTKKFASFRNPAGNNIYVMFEDSKGNFWVGASHNALYGFDKATGTFQPYINSSSESPSISAPVEKKNISGSEDRITFINEDASGGIWIGTTRSGINHYDPATNKTLHFESDNQSQFTDKSGQSAYSSTDGLFWISTVEGSLYKIDPILNTIPHYSTNGPVFAIYNDPFDVLWVGTANGLVRNENGSTQVFSYDAFNPSSISNNIVFSIYEDSQNKLWIGTNGGGLNLFNKATRTFSNYRYDSKNKQSLVNDVVYSMCEDGERNMWVGTGNGLDLMDKVSGKFTHYLHSSKDTGSIGNNFIEAIIKDNDNNIWIGSGYRGGINKLQRSSNKFAHYLGGRSIFSLFHDSSNTIWAGTDSGLYYMKPSFGGFFPFIDSNLNTSSTAVIAIVEDPQKRLWINSSLGIIELDRNRKIIGLYGKRYGLSPTNYVLRAGFANSKGQIFFSSNDGYYSFDQNLLTPNLKLPRLMLTDFRLMDQSVKAGTGPLNQEINNTDRLRLSYKQNVFSFDFAALDFTSSEDNQHFFMLENYDNGWHKAGTDRKAYYFNVPPGHYVFRVKGFNGNGFGTEKKIDIVISPPWWRTWWAYLLFASVIAGGIWGIVYYRGRTLRRKNKLLEDTVNQRTVELQQSFENLKSAQSQLIQSEKMASLGELTAGVAHEIQNPLNFVNNFSEVNKELADELLQEIDNRNYNDVKTIARNIKDNEEKINHHGKRADAIVKGMLQHSRKSTGIKELTDINALANEYLRLSYHGLRAKDKTFNATMETDLDSNVGMVNVIPQDIGRVFLNLYNNAFYAIKEKESQNRENYKPTVHLSTRKHNGKIEIKVKDNGGGIPEKMMDKIFQPFFTTKPTGQGTGLGLSLSYDIIKAHDGEIKVATKQDEGTEFTVLIPLKSR